MEAIDTLMAEHQVILRACAALAAFAEEVQRGGGDPAELARFVQFIREYADALHHGKEEDVLFAAMVQAGFPRQAGPVGVMLLEHGQGRACVAELAGLAAAPAPWTADDRARLVEASLGYAGLLRAHIHKEDAILYPMAEQRLPAALAQRVDEACRALDERHAADGSRARLERLAEALAARHGGALATAATG